MARNLCVVPGLPESVEIRVYPVYGVARNSDFWRTVASASFVHDNTNARSRWPCGRSRNFGDITVSCLRIHQEYMFFGNMDEYLFPYKVLHVFRVISVRAMRMSDKKYVTLTNEAE